MSFSFRWGLNGSNGHLKVYNIPIWKKKNDKRKKIKKKEKKWNEQQQQHKTIIHETRAIAPFWSAIIQHPNYILRDAHTLLLMCFI